MEWVVFVVCVLLLFVVVQVFKLAEMCVYRRVSLPEWSKGLRSGRNVFELVGSNPTADILLRIAAQYHAYHFSSLLLPHASHLPRISTT